MIFGEGIDVVEKAPAKDVNLNETGANALWGQHGWRYTNKSGKLLSKDAILNDSTYKYLVAKNSRQVFETTALAIKGRQTNTYYGSVRWGWRTDANSNFTKIPLQVVSQGVPSSTFIKSAELWNSSQTSKKESTLNLPIENVQLINKVTGVNMGSGPPFIHLPFETRVVVKPGFPSRIDSFIRVVDGPHTGKTGLVKNSDLSDERP